MEIDRVHRIIVELSNGSSIDENLSNRNIDEIYSVLLDPTFRDEMSHFDHKLNSTGSAEDWKNCEVPDKTQITLAEFKETLKRTSRSSESYRYICGSAAIFLYRLTFSNLYNFDDEQFFPNDIDFISFVKFRNVQRKFSCESNIWIYDGELRAWYLGVQYPSHGIYEFKLKYGHEELQRRLVDSNQAIKTQKISKDVEGPKEFVSDFDLSVTKIIYDIETDSFDLTDPSVIEDINNMVSRYYKIPDNFYLDRFGKRRITSKALRRILKYRERGFKLFESSGGAINLSLKELIGYSLDELTTDIIHKLIDENFDLENSKICRTSGNTDEETKTRYVYNLLVKYGFAKTLASRGRYDPYEFAFETPVDPQYRYMDIMKKISDILDEETTFFTEHRYRVDRKFDTKKFYFSGSSVLHLKNQSVVPGDIDVYLNLNLRESLFDFALLYLTEEDIMSCPISKYDYDSIFSREDRNWELKDILYNSWEFTFSLKNQINQNIEKYYEEYRLEKRLENFMLHLREKLGEGVTVEGNTKMGTEPYTKGQEIVWKYNIQGFKVQFIISKSKVSCFSNVNDNFDMNFCRPIIYFKDGLPIYRSTPSIEQSIQNKRSEYCPKAHNFVHNGNRITLNEKSIERVNKYIDRGYELIWMGKKLKDGSEISVEVIPNENLKYFYQYF